MSDQKSNKPQNTQLSELEESHLHGGRSGAGAIKKTGSFLAGASGYRSLKKNMSIVKHRASFPLLRRVLSNELKISKSKPEIVDALTISEVDLDRSYFWHTIIIAITAPALIWSILILTKALAVGIKFDVWTPMLNQGLYTSVPMILFTASKLYVSWHSRKAFKKISLLKGREA